MAPWPALEKFKQARKKRVGRRSDEQQNPPVGNEQENPQGGDRSSVAVSIAFLMPVESGWVANGNYTAQHRVRRLTKLLRSPKRRSNSEQHHRPRHYEQLREHDDVQWLGSLYECQWTHRRWFTSLFCDGATLWLIPSVSV